MIEQKRLQSHPHICTVPEEQKEKIMEIAMRAGHILLENGAEISRVEKTIDRICRHYGIESANSFVLSNGIFSTMGNERESFFARVQHIPVSGAHLNRVAAVNQLSREIEEGKHTVEELGRCLDDIEQMPGKRKGVQIGASAVGSGAFCYLLGGDLADSAAAFLSGLVLYVYILYIGKNLSKLVQNILGGGLVTFCCVVLYHLGLGHHISSMIIGSVIPMIPGVAFTNGIRDITDGDYIAGSVRMMDAGLVVLSIALGMGLVLTMYYRLTGGTLL